MSTIRPIKPAFRGDFLFLAFASTLLLACFPFLGFTLTTTSIISGSWTDPSIWDNGVPTTSDNAIIASGHTVTLVGATTSVTDFEVQSGAQLQAFGLLFNVNGNLTLNGNIDGASQVGVGTPCSSSWIDGSGYFSTTAVVSLMGNIDILATADISMVGGDFQLASIIGCADPVVDNYGTVSLGPAELTSIGTNGTFNNHGIINSGSEVFKKYSGNGILDASYVGNIVNYYLGGDQFVKVPLTSYYHIYFATSGTKTMCGSIDVNGDLIIRGVAQLDANNYNINLAGDWRDSSTHADPFVDTASTVTFDGSGGQSIVCTATGSKETFWKMYVGKSGGTLTSEDDIDVTREFKMTNGNFLIDAETVTCDYLVDIDAGILQITGGAFMHDHNSDVSWDQSGGTFDIDGGTVTVGDYTGNHYDTDYNMSGGTLDISAGTLTISDALHQSGGTFNVSSTAIVNIRAYQGVGHGDTGPKLDLNGGNFNMSGGTINLKGAYDNTIANPAMDLNNTTSVTGGTIVCTKTGANDEDFFIKTNGNAIHHLTIDK